MLSSLLQAGWEATLWPKRDDGFEIRVRAVNSNAPPPRERRQDQNRFHPCELLADADPCARPEWEVLHEIVPEVTGKNGFVSIEGLFNQMAAEIPAYAGLTWGSLGDQGKAAQI